MSEGMGQRLELDMGDEKIDLGKKPGFLPLDYMSHRFDERLSDLGGRVDTIRSLFPGQDFTTSYERTSGPSGGLMDRLENRISSRFKPYRTGDFNTIFNNRKSIRQRLF